MNIPPWMQKILHRIMRRIDRITPCRRRLPWYYYWLILYFSSHIRREEYLNDIADAHQEIMRTDKLSSHFYLIKETTCGLIEVIIHHVKYMPIFLMIPFLGKKILWYGYVAFDFLNRFFM